MGFAAMAWAWKQELPSTPKFVLVALADHADDATLVCWPSLTHLAQKCGLDRSTVIRSLEALERLGKISREQREHRQTTRYTLVAQCNQSQSAPRCVKQLDAQRNEIGAESDTEPKRTHSSSLPTEENRPPKKQPRRAKAKTEYAADPRREPLTKFIFETYTERHGELSTDKSDWEAQRQYLARNKAALEEIQRRWMAFLESTEPFHRRQGHPMRYFFTNINAFPARASPVVASLEERLRIGREENAKKGITYK